jgi:hypothetical protein
VSQKRKTQNTNAKPAKVEEKVMIQKSVEATFSRGSEGVVNKYVKT